MSFSFHPEAEIEFNDSIDYYEKKEAGLGYDFATEVHSAIERAVSFPDAWSMIAKDIRRALVRRFPYGVLYSESEDDGEIYIIAVMPLYRRPEYWQHRK